MTKPTKVQPTLEQIKAVVKFLPELEAIVRQSTLLVPSVRRRA